MEVGLMKVFISHIAEEAALASVLKDWIESTFLGQVDVFVKWARHKLWGAMVSPVRRGIDRREGYVGSLQRKVSL